MKNLGKSDSEFIGSILTQSAKPKLSDGILQTAGNEIVDVTYTDENTESGKTNHKVISQVEMVSGASAGFTNGAFNEFVEGTAGGKKFFVSVKDFDRNISDKKDKITIWR